MPASKAKTFRARLELMHKTLRWTVARIPFDLARTWPERHGQRVRGSINGFTFRTTLVALLEGKGWVLVVNKQMQRAAAVRLGNLAEIRLEPDLEERAVEVPPEFAAILKAEPELRRWFNKLSESDRREVGKRITQPKSNDARKKRAEQMAERMLLAMEGEITPPPVLQLAFRRQPLAQAGWQAMTPTQRRRHLLGIFYYRSPEARDRRTQQAVDEAVRVAQRDRSLLK